MFEVSYDVITPFQPESQPCLTHDEMNADYPRFGSIADVHLTSDDREMLMVCFRFICMSTGDLWNGVCMYNCLCVYLCV